MNRRILSALLIIFLLAGAPAVIYWKGLKPSAIIFSLLLVLGGGICAAYLNPNRGERPILRMIFTLALKALYAVKARGLEHVAAAGGNVMIVANHQSFLDGVLLAVFLPGRYVFVVNRRMAGHWWARPFLRLVDVHTLDAENPMAIKSLVKILQAGGRLVIFPEGRITLTGALMKIHDGPALIADKAGSSILPVKIDGALATHFSRLEGQALPRLFPRISLAALPARKLDIQPGAAGARRRRQAGESLENIMRHMMFEGADIQRTVPQAVWDAMGVFGKNRLAASDESGTILTYGQLTARAAAYGAGLEKIGGKDRFAGILLHNSANALPAILGAQMAGYAPAILDPSWGIERILPAIKAGGIRALLTSRAMEPMAAELEKNGVKTAVIEDLKEGFAFSGNHGQGGAEASLRPAALLFIGDGPDEGWIVHSHRGLLSGVYQLAAGMDLGPADSIFCAPPLAGYGGLLLGMAAPLTLGIRSFQFSSQAARAVCAGFYESNATVFFGDDEFLYKTAMEAHPYDFFGARMALALGNRLSGDTRRIWSGKLGRETRWILGGEITGVISAESPMKPKPGTAGRLLPGARARAEGASGSAGQTGVLAVAGPAMAAGRVNPADPEGPIIPCSPWTPLGIKGNVDEEGYLTLE